jgi:hypothetical protein
MPRKGSRSTIWRRSATTAFIAFFDKTFTSLATLARQFEAQADRWACGVLQNDVLDRMEATGPAMPTH